MLAVQLATAAVGIKLRLEERWMEDTFGNQYRRYRADTPALIPRLR